MNPIVKFDEAKVAYLRNLRFRGKSDCTLTNYESRLDNFKAFWAAQHNGAPSEDPTHADVTAWRDSLFEAGRKPSTILQYLVELGAFFGTMQDPIFGEHLTYASNPVSKQLYPTVKKRPYDQILTDDEVKKLLPNRCPEAHMKSTWPRNYAIIALLLSTKLRNAEVLDLRLCDLDFENAELSVNHGKGDKFRITEFPPFAQSAVLLYLVSGLRPATLPDTAPLFGTTADNTFGCNARAIASGAEKWHRGSSQWLSSLVERHVKSLTGVSNVRTHDLRHVGARLELNAGASLEYLQSELGHENMSTTQIYAGKLQTKRGRASAQEVFAQMNQVAAQNMRLYEVKKLFRAAV